MTTGTTVLGLFPLVVMPGAGSELYRGLGSVVLGGLVVSTFLTLFLVPSVFSLVMDGRNLIFQRRSFGHAAKAESGTQGQHTPEQHAAGEPAFSAPGTPV